MALTLSVMVDGAPAETPAESLLQLTLFTIVNCVTFSNFLLVRLLLHCKMKEWIYIRSQQTQMFSGAMTLA